MGVEEQKEEREVLDSIFPDEITGRHMQRSIAARVTDKGLTDVSDTAYRISIALDVPDDQQDEPTEPPVILLNVAYPDAYPDVGPHLDITSPPNAAKHPQLDVADDKAELLEALQPMIEDSLGMAMVFTLVTTLKEAAESLISERLQKAEAVRDSELRQKEEEENRRFHGALVTREKFIEWREKFRKEMQEKERKQKEEEEAEDKKKKAGKPDEKRITGRQLWESGLVGKGEEDVEGEDAIAAVEKLKVTE